MIRAIIFTAVGYWLSRQVYLRYDFAKREEEKINTKRKLQIYLETVGWSEKEIKEALNRTFNDE